MRYCRGPSVLLFLLGALCSPFSHAVELMKWERIPLQVPLTVGQERIVFVDKNVKVGFPASLDGKLRIQSSGGTVYLDARAAFPATRLVLKDVESGEIVLMDVSERCGSRYRLFIAARWRAPSAADRLKGITVLQVWRPVARATDIRLQRRPPDRMRN